LAQKKSYRLKIDNCLPSHAIGLLIAIITDMKNWVLVWGWLATTTMAIAQPAYKIDFKIKGWKDTTAYLGNYYGESTVLKDTALVRGGSFSFDGKKTLPQGVYFLVLGKTKLLDFVVGADQFFQIETDMQDYMGHLAIKGDEDNRVFLENVNFIQKKQKEAEPFRKVVLDSTLSEAQKKDARAALQKLNKEVTTFQDDLFQKYPQLLTTRFLKATREIEVPEPPRKADGSIDSSFQWKYYRQHFFDNFDVGDDALIRLPRPFYQEKIKEYLDKLFVPDPDTIMKAINQLVTKAKKNQETYKYLVYNCMYTYQNHPIMGMDAVYVRLYDTYFASGEMDFWVNAAMKKNLKEHADKVRMSLIGMTGPNLIMLDDKLQVQSMYDLKKKFTVLYFFNPDCGACKVETPKLVEFFNKNKTKMSIGVYAVSSDTSMQKMKDYIRDMKIPFTTVNGPRTLVGNYQKLYDAFSTPTMYVLDERKKIIAKKIPIEKLEDFLFNYEQFQKRKEAAAHGGSSGK
jgi:peroxiredoxin